MNLQQAATVLVMALIPGTPPELAVEQACDLLGGRYPLKNSAATELAQQLVDLVVDGRIPRPVRVCQARSTQGLYVGPNLGFDVIGMVPRGQAINAWRELLAWTLVSFEGPDGSQCAGWLKGEHLEECLDAQDAGDSHGAPCA